MDYVISITGSGLVDLYLASAFPRFVFTDNFEVALRLPFEQACQQSAYLMKYGISHRIFDYG